MFLNYLKITLRNIIKQKTYSFINIVGLSVGMASFILIALWVQDELNYDKFHDNFNNLYRILEHEKYSEGDELYFTQTPAGLAPILNSDYPEIVTTARVRRNSKIISYQEKQFNESRVLFADATFYDIFSFPVTKGDIKTLQTDPYSIAITEDMAVKYFADKNPIGKILKIDNQVDLKIAGILKNAPSNSHLQYDFIVPFERLKDFGFQLEGFNSYAFATYVLLNENADPYTVSSKIKNIIKDNDEAAIVTLSIQHIREIHLYSSGIWGLGGDGDIKYIYIFSAIALFVLLTACINFMNLATARSSKRAKEVGLRKVIGANRKELIFQFFNESLLISFLAMIFSFVIVSLFLPAFNQLSGKALQFSLVSNHVLFIIVIITVVSTGIIAGSYPALVLSAFQPVKTLKGALSSGKKGTIFRRILVSIQFVLTICLIFGTLVINRQLHFIKNQELGYNKNHVFSIPLKGNLSTKTDFLKNQLNMNSNILNISATTDPPTQVRRSFIVREWEGHKGEEKFLAHFLGTDENFLNTLKLQMSQGRFFSKDFISDSTAIIINEAALSIMGLENPVGKSIMESYHIIGVIKDFHFKSLHEAISPLILFYQPREYNQLLVKINSQNISKTIEAIKQKWQMIVPDYPMEYQFLDDHIDRLYRADQRIEKIINVFTVLALLIAILGLFGMASYIAEQRTKEIGIRKVLGATIPGILTLLSKELVKWIVIANIFALPVGWFIMNKWLQNFAYRMELNIWMFLSSGIVALLVAIITISTQAIKAAIANPVESLKYE